MILHIIGPARSAAMQPVVTDVVLSMVCMLVTRVSYTKTAELFEMLTYHPFGGGLNIVSRNLVLDESADPTWERAAMRCD